MTTASAVIIGRSRLLVACVEKLRKAGVEVISIATTDPAALSYAAEQRIRTTHPDRIFMDLGSNTFDYLISAVNMRVLPPEILAMPQVAAINFHDGPLPAMRGAHVSAWSTYLGDRTSCATWHLMDEAVDEGAVLAERSFGLHEYSTALSVMYDSMLHGAEAFEDLVPFIVNREVPPLLREPDPGSEETGRLFKYTDRPGHGLIHSGMSSKEMSRLGRSYDHGRAFNPLGVPLVVSGDLMVHVRQVREIGGSRPLTAGCSPRVEQITRSSIVLTTTNGGAALSDFVAMDGSALSGDGAAQRLGLREGDELLAPVPGLLDTLMELQPSLRAQEPRWRRALRGAESLRYEHAPFSASTSGYDRHELSDVGEHEPVAVVEAFLSSLALAVDSDQKEWSFAYSSAEHLELHQRTKGYSVQRVPVRYLGEDPSSLRSAFAAAHTTTPYPTDLEVREGLAHRYADNTDPSFTSVMVLRREPNQPAEAEPDTDFALLLTTGSAPVVLVRASNPAGVNASTLGRGIETTLTEQLPAPSMPPGEEGSPSEPLQAPALQAPEDLLSTIVSLATDSKIKDRPAVVSGEECISYADLLSRADVIGVDLIANGVKAGDTVGLMLIRSIDLVASMLAVLRIGAAYTPLDPEAPTERLQGILKNANASVLLHSLEYMARASTLGFHFVSPPPWNPPAGTRTNSVHPAISLAPEHASEGLAYVLFTSGSTGEPKGVAVGRKALSHFAADVRDRVGFCPDDLVLAHTTTTFDISILELLVPLTAGSTILLADDSESRDPKRLGDLAKDARIVQGTPTMLSMMLRTGWQPSQQTTVLAGGEALPAHVADTLLEGAGNVLNMYGPTEATVWVSATPVTQGSVTTIEDALPHVDLIVVNDNGDPIEQGDGELLIRGPQLADGYVSNPESTQLAFQEHPALGRVYRTGDIVRITEQGRIRWLNRKDGQLNVRGRRIESEEVEAALEQHPGVDRAVVVTRSSGGDIADLLVAYVAASSTLDRGSVRASIEQILPSWMAPDLYVVVDAIPLTSSGKTDRAALPKPNEENILRSAPTMQDANETDHTDDLRKLCQTLGNHLGGSPLSPDDNVFDLGATSFLIPTLAGTASTTLGRDVTAAMIFATGTPRRLHELIGASSENLSRDADKREHASYPVPRTEASNVAVVGLAARTAGAHTADEFFQLLLDKRITSSKDPTDRDDPVGAPAEGPAATHWMDGVNRFAPKRFGLSTREARRMDPLQRLALSITAEALDSSGFGPTSPMPERTGVYVGAIASDYPLTLPVHEFDDAHAVTGQAMSMIANRVSHTFGWNGPSYVIDTACSSSMFALHQARKDLLLGEIDAAVVIGVNVIHSELRNASFRRNGMLSPEHALRPFAKDANGYVRGEGAVAMILREGTDAREHGDPILGHIAGTAVNHRGRFAGHLTAPSVTAEEDVIRRAWDTSGVPTNQAGYIEAHGTGTALGDQIELQATANAFANAQEVLIGSVKANIGHLEPAAGLAGVAKTLLSMRRGIIPPSPYANKIDPVNVESLNVRVINETETWPEGRIGGVSSFGMGGSNAHVVISPADPSTDTDLNAYPIVISADTDHDLRTTATRLLDRITTEPGTNLGKLAATLAHREVREHRAGCVVTALDQLEDKLSLICVNAGNGYYTADGTLPRSRSAEGALGRAHRQVEQFVADGTPPESLTDHGRAWLPPAASFEEEMAPPHLDPSAEPSAHEAQSRHQRSWVPPPSGVEEEMEPRRGNGPAEALPSVIKDYDADRRVALHGLDADSAQHIVQEIPVVPGAAFIGRILRELGDGSRARIERVLLHEKLQGDEAELALESRSLEVRSSGRTILSAQRFSEGNSGNLIQLAPVSTPTQPLYVESFYRAQSAWGLEYGPDFRVIKEASSLEGYAEAVLSIPEGVATPWATVVIDGALQVGLIATGAEGLHVPFSIGTVEGNLVPAGTYMVRASAQPVAGLSRSATVTVSIGGRVLLRLDDIVWRPVAGSQAASPNGQEASTHDPAVSSVPRAILRSVGGGSLTDSLVSAVAQRLEVDPTEIDTDEPLEAQGMDSTLAVALAQDLSSDFSVDLPPTFMLELGSLREVSRVLREDYGVAPAGLTSQDSDDAPLAAAATEDEPHLSPVEDHTVSVESRPDSAATGPAQPATVRAEAPGTNHGSVAIIGMDALVPGEHSEGLWGVVRDKVDALGPIPQRRDDLASIHSDDGEVGTSYLPRAGFLEAVERFDSKLFSLPPAEAKWIDPQQRHLLSSVWRALEDASVAGVDGDRTGVFVGASYTHYRDRIVKDVVPTAAGLGNHNALLANRVSYFFDLQGPSMTIDTLCSSSLVALHRAVQSLRLGECDTAVVAGVHMALSSQYLQLGSRLRSFSPSGACRSFDAEADGFVPGEGVVTVVLKRAEDAVADGDRVRAVIRGAAVNHGGRTAGLTVPSSSAQASVIDAALKDAQVDPRSIDLVEAHGTGTSLGDPIEIEGLTAAWRRYTSDCQFAAIGSIKSNIGHLEPAAGLAGLAKVVMALENEVIPASVNLERPNPRIRFEDSPFYLADQAREWPRGERVRRAAVSAFGMGGVNAHVIVEEAPARPNPDNVDPTGASQILRITGATEDAVRELAGRYADEFQETQGSPESLASVQGMCRAVTRGRRQLRWQTAVTGGTDSIISELRKVHRGETGVPKRPNESAPVTFAYSGQGSQYSGMLRTLSSREPVVEQTFAELDRALAAAGAEHSFTALLELPDKQLRLTQNAQPAIVGSQVAITRLLESWGIRCSSVIGHSVGELTAAWASGVLSLENLMKAAILRGRAMGDSVARGGMAAVMLGPEELATLLEEERWQGLSVAAYNGPTSSTIAGPNETIDGFLRVSGAKGRKLDVSHPFHSQAMEDSARKFETQVAGLLPERGSVEPSVPFASTVTGRWHDSFSVNDPRTWGRGIAEPIRFGQAYGLLGERGHPVVVEIGPQTVLASLMRSHGGERIVLPTLRRPAVGSEQADMHGLLSAISAHVEIAWDRVHPASIPVVAAPGYPMSDEELATPDPLDLAPASAAHSVKVEETDGPFTHPIHGVGDLVDA